MSNPRSLSLPCAAAQHSSWDQTELVLEHGGGEENPRPRCTLSSSEATRHHRNARPGCWIRPDMVLNSRWFLLPVSYSISDRCWWARKAWPSLLLPCVVAMLKGSKNCTTTCLQLKCSASNQAMRDLAFISPPHARARLLTGKASSFPPENRCRSLRRVSAWRGCFRFLYHIIKLRQVLNNFSSLRRRGRFS